ncbi:hypothetical protein BOX15_Mlig003448g3, partial [Macrostomum lignano]
SHQLTKFRLDTNNSHPGTTDNGRHQETRGRSATVQETMLKRRKAAMEARSTRARQQAADRRLARRQRVKKTKEAFVRVERLVKLGRLKDRDTNRLNRLARRPAAAEPMAPVVTLLPTAAEEAPQSSAERPILIVRCRGRSAGMDPRIVKALRLFRLTRLNTAVFAKPTPACLSVLRLLDPFVAWGAPDMRSVRELVYKRGRASGSQSEAGNQQRPVPITDNAAIEAALGKYGLLCIEDLVHELATCGPAFVQAASYLAPMRLKAPLGGWAKAEARFRATRVSRID